MTKQLLAPWWERMWPSLIPKKTKFQTRTDDNVRRYLFIYFVLRTEVNELEFALVEMANTTDKFAASVHQTNPQNLIEYIMRQKIYDSLYWKQNCFGLSAEDVVDKGVEIRFLGGMFGEPQKPTDFICLVLKLLQIQPEKEIILEYIRNDEFKYLRLLGAFYMRLVGRAVEVYQYLEPLLNDYRRVRVRRPDGSFALSHIDEIIDEMLRQDHLFNIAMPRLPQRKVLEETGQLGPKESVLQGEFDKIVQEQQLKQRYSVERDPIYAFSEKQSREKWKLSSKEKRKGPTHGRRSDRDIEDDRIDKTRGTKSGRKRDYEDLEEGEVKGSKDSMSVEDTNALRAKLGLAPLK
jgi:pre-mRNA-splicing factor 38A